MPDGAVQVIRFRAVHDGQVQVDLFDFKKTNRAGAGAGKLLLVVFVVGIFTLIGEGLLRLLLCNFPVIGRGVI